MADNLAMTPGAGANVATDDIGGIHYQRVKVTWGPDGTANDADVATGKPLPIQLRSPTGTTLLGSAGSSATDVLTVQGIASGTALPVSVATVPTHAVTQSGTWTVQPGNTANTTAWKVDGSAVTQPVSLPAAMVGTAGSAGTSVVTVQGITSGTRIPVFIADSGGSEVAIELSAAQLPAALLSGRLAVAVTDSAGNELNYDSSDTGTVASNTVTVAATIIASNANRFGGSLQASPSNTANCYVLCSGTGTVSSTLMSMVLAPGGYFEVPSTYTGRVTIVAASGTQTVFSTEYT
jgi:hypothetical protein